MFGLCFINPGVCELEKIAIMASTNEGQPNMDSEEGTEIPKPDDAGLAITIFIACTVALLVGGYYLWKYRSHFGFEDNRCVLKKSLTHTFPTSYY